MTVATSKEARLIDAVRLAARHASVVEDEDCSVFSAAARIIGASDDASSSISAIDAAHTLRSASPFECAGSDFMASGAAITRDDQRGSMSSCFNRHIGYLAETAGDTDFLLCSVLPDLVEMRDNVGTFARSMLVLIPAHDDHVGLLQRMVLFRGAAYSLAEEWCEYVCQVADMLDQDGWAIELSDCGLPVRAYDADMRYALPVISFYNWNEHDKCPSMYEDAMMILRTHICGPEYPAMLSAVRRLRNTRAAISNRESILRSQLLREELAHSQLVQQVADSTRSIEAIASELSALRVGGTQSIARQVRSMLHSEESLRYHPAIAEYDLESMPARIVTNHLTMHLLDERGGDDCCEDCYDDCDGGCDCHAEQCVDFNLYVGKIIIEIDDDENFGDAIVLYGYEDRGTIVHPHISGGGSKCFGDAAAPLAEAWARGDMASVISYICGWLTQYNPASPHRDAFYLYEEYGSCSLPAGWGTEAP